jgi:ElaB/YqjD/DUF883 family membrane-anchored ribosome-binding protein
VDEEPRTSRSEVEPGARAAGAPRDPDEIKREIEETRGQLGETVEALAEKTDVKARARDRVDERKARLKSKAGDIREKISGATPEQAQQGAGQVAERAREQPLPFAVAGAFAAGLVIGMLIKRS